MDIEKQIQQEKTTTSPSSPTKFLSFFFLKIYPIVSPNQQPGLMVSASQGKLNNFSQP